ncbi:class I tRNA ligase family protein [Sphaerisporangium sp. TRM90804]|uniref:class I tRNA ligase family protein n=1 Tax=Sphaerisporangium sp. TRM90804 TaxID=3031113 RepID=UPI00244A7C9D|nr:class I tRNA ligase family protein [Sphaerisporangium sp. TRM90804]MDH2429178.1 class I tRNA ligase family protein [Sphaerisporangium sp. TRM90804]
MREKEPRGLTVIRSPHPTPNGPLHVGHLSGPYIAADVAARAARDRGERVLAICGTDDHQNSVLVKARAGGERPEDVINRHTEVIQRTLTSTGVGYDVFTRPYGDQTHHAVIRKLVDEMASSGLLATADRALLACGDCGRSMHNSYVSGTCPLCGAGKDGGTCEVCGGFTSAAEMLDPTCASCGTVPVEARGPGLVFRLEDYREELTSLWTRALLPPSVRALLGLHLARELPELPVTHPTDWGIQIGGERLDAWFEMGLSYLTTVGGHLAPDVRALGDYAAAWQGVSRAWSFLGLDTAFYYAVLFPAVFTAAGVPGAARLNGLTVNELYLYEGGKFSTSRGHAIWAADLLRDADPAIVRLFMCWDRPDTHSTDFTMQAFTRFQRRWAPLVDVVRATAPAIRPAAGPCPETARAAQALRLDHFDPALALRCLYLAITEHDDPEAARLLKLIM